jgi:transcriptional regulator GlxA family with amidase domain
MRTIGVLLFPQFELLDVCGPVEVLGHRLLADRQRVVMIAREASPVASVQGTRLVADAPSPTVRARRAPRARRSGHAARGRRRGPDRLDRDDRRRRWAPRFAVRCARRTPTTVSAQ